MKNSKTVKISIIIAIAVSVSVTLLYLFENQNDINPLQTLEPKVLQCPLGTYASTYSGDQGFAAKVNRYDKYSTWFNYVLGSNKEGIVRLTYKTDSLDYSIKNQIKLLGISPQEYFKPTLLVLNEETGLINTTNKTNTDIFTSDVVFIDDYETLVTYKIKAGSDKENYVMKIPEVCYPPLLLTVGTEPYQGLLPSIQPAGEEKN
ncbi:MAG: hypothetical protein WAO91_05220 [Candidatus Nitrosotenuis sp.]